MGTAAPHVGRGLAWGESRAAALHKPLINNMCYRYRRDCETPAPGLRRDRALPDPIPSHPLPEPSPCGGAAVHPLPALGN